MRFRKKPVVIEAFQWTIDAMPDWFREKSKDYRIDVQTGSLFIATLEGIHEAKAGDFIIKGIQGEFYPCKPDIFKETYEPVE